MRPLKGLCLGLALIPGLSLATQGVDNPRSDAAAQFNLRYCQSTALYRSSAVALGEADVAVEVGDYTAALSSLDSGIDRIGYEYLFPGLNDDTGAALGMSRTLQQQRGQLQVAINLKRRVLLTRIANYCWKRARRVPEK